jgi:hypothetical protein
MLILECAFLGGADIPVFWTRFFPHLLPYDIVGFVKHSVLMFWMTLATVTGMRRRLEL